MQYSHDDDSKQQRRDGGDDDKNPDDDKPKGHIRACKQLTKANRSVPRSLTTPALHLNTSIVLCCLLRVERTLIEL